jgi:hypothetical protein
MTTLADMQTTLARRVRDTTNATWSADELADLINAGIGAVSDLAPREIAQTVGTVAANVYTYDASSFSFAYRVDVYASSGELWGEIPISTQGADDGWSLHGGVLYTPPSWQPPAGSTIRLFGYAAYAQLSSTTSTTDLTSRLQAAVLLFARIEAMDGLLADRAAFGQWQSDPDNRDTTLLALAQTVNILRRRWDVEARAIRKMRKL